MSGTFCKCIKANGFPKYRFIVGRRYKYETTEVPYQGLMYKAYLNNSSAREIAPQYFKQYFIME